MPDTPTGPLAGLRVIECTGTLAGAFAATMLADFGAEVSRVPVPSDAVTAARWDFETGVTGSLAAGEIRGRRLIGVEEIPGDDELAAFVGRFDLLVMDQCAPRSWRDAAELAERMSPRLVQIVITPFGLTGPLAGQGGDDRTAQAFSGMLNVTGYTDREPMPVMVPVAEYWTGLLGACGALTALRVVACGGPGQVVDLGMYETALRYQEEFIIQAHRLGIVRRRMGNEYAETVPSNHFESRDGQWVAISAADNATFDAVLRGIERPDLIGDPRLNDRAARVTNRVLVNELIGDWVGSHDVKEVLRSFVDEGAPIARLSSAADLLADEHAQARDLIAYTRADGVDVAVPAAVPRLSRLPGAVRPNVAEPPPAAAPVDTVVPEQPPALPLHGLKVIDLGRFVAGPLAATYLADFGADVLKVELASGDSTRARPPVIDGVGLSFPVTNRNKSSVTVDLRTEDGVRTLLELVRVADVLVENFRPGTLERYGLSPERLWEANPALVIGRVSGFGQDGPYSGRPAFDRVGLGMGGLSFLGGDKERAPLRPGPLVGDTSAGLFGLFGILAALFGRTNSGVGELVDASLMESVFRMNAGVLTAYSRYGRLIERSSAAHPLYPHAEVLAAGDDRLVCVSAPVDRADADIAAALAGPDAEPPEDWRKALADLVRGTTADEAVRLVRAAGLYAAAVMTATDILADEHVAARGNLVTHRHPVLGDLCFQGAVPRLTRTPGSVRFVSTAPGAEQHKIVEWTSPQPAGAQS